MKTGNVVRAPQIHNKSNEPILNHMNERHQRLSQMVHLKNTYRVPITSDFYNCAIKYLKILEHLKILNKR